MSKQKCSNKGSQLQVVLEELVEQANEVVQFSQRNRELNAQRFVQVVVLGWLQQPKASLNQLAQAGKALGCKISGSALHERMGREAVALLGRVLVNALQQVQPYGRLPIEALATFSAVHVTDSTQICLPPTMRQAFEGSNGEAKMKLQVTLDYLTGQWVGLEMAAGKSSDQHSDLPQHQAKAGSLNLFDLGYVKQERLRDIDAQQAYFVCRYQTQTALYHRESGERFDLEAYLRTLSVDARECEVAFGARLHLPVRLVARRLSLASAAARRRKAKQKYHADGKTCSSSYLYLLGWDILITNLPQTLAPFDLVFDLYPIRTQIEWLFRVWKSQLQVDHFGHWRLERVLVQLYAHLIGILLGHRLTAGSLWRDGLEPSFLKCVQVLQTHIHDLLRCIARAWRGLRPWCQRLEDAFRLFGRKTKRKKAPSTFDSLLNWCLS